MRDGKVQIGIIGCGGIANNKHFPSLKACSDKNDIIGFCDIVKERAVKAAKEFGTSDAKVYTDYHELLKDTNIDLVHVLVSNVAHCPITVSAFEAGKHVLCEKPLAHCSSDAEKMVEAWKKSGKKFTIGYQNRFREEVLALHKSCENDELGDIYFAKAHAIRRRAVPTWGVFPNKALQGGGPLIDIGTHALDITLWMMNNYKPVSVTGSVYYKMRDNFEGNVFGPWDPKTFEVEDSAFGMIKMEDGATIFLESSWALNVQKSKEACTTLCGTKAGAHINSGGSYKTNELVYNKAKNGLLMDETISPKGVVAYFEGAGSAEGITEANQWLDAIINNGEPLVKPEQALVVTKILEAIYKSAEIGKEVYLG